MKTIIILMLLVIQLRAELRFQMRNNFNEIKVYGVLINERFESCVAIYDGKLWNLSDLNESLIPISKIYKIIKDASADRHHETMRRDFVDLVTVVSPESHDVNNLKNVLFGGVCNKPFAEVVDGDEKLYRIRPEKIKVFNRFKDGVVFYDSRKQAFFHWDFGLDAQGHLVKVSVEEVQ